MDLLKMKITKLRIALKAYESGLLNNSCQQILQVVNTDGSTRAVGPIPLPTRRRLYCVLRSPHVNKDAREHFEIRTHKRLIDIYQPTEETLQNLRNLDLPAGVDVEIKNI
nr:ribosomal protein S10 [Ochrosphaera neapolitana]